MEENTSLYSITQNDQLLDEYKSHFDKQYYTTAISCNDVLAIPGLKKKGEYVFEDETISFIKYCRKNDHEHKFDILSKGDIKLNSLHSVDLLFPVLVISQQVMLPAVLNLLTSYIYDRIRVYKNTAFGVKVSIVYGDETNNTRIDYNGPAKDFHEVVEAINKLGK